MLAQPGLTQDARFASNSLRHEHRDELKSLIEHTFSSLTIQDVVQSLDEAGIANAHINDMKDVWAHPQLKARSRWVEVESPGGTIAALKPPGQHQAFEARMDAVPSLGQHTESILSELGYDPASMNRLRSEGCI